MIEITDFMKPRKFKIALVVGARPNFMKAAPLLKAMRRSSFFDPILIHTGQHYDFLMSDKFFQDLRLPKPDIFLGVGSGSHAEQTAKIMIASEKSLFKTKTSLPDLVIVVGDVNSTLAVALTAKKIGVPVAHVEAGLRSFDEAMPEEINRVLTDHISNFLFTTEESANKNLKREGINSKRIYFVGNVMIDSLRQNQLKISQSSILKQLNLKKGAYGVLTLHRPTNVDNKKSFLRILKALNVIQKQLPIIFPVHPRTKKQIESLGLKNYFQKLKNLVLIDPLGYIDFMKLMSCAKLVFTDSGGLQEETTVFGVPCLTLRNNTERPVTVQKGTNIIVGDNTEKIIKETRKILSGNVKKGTIPKNWDGKSAERIIKVLLKNL